MSVKVGIDTREEMWQCILHLVNIFQLTRKFKTFTIYVYYPYVNYMFKDFSIVLSTKYSFLVWNIESIMPIYKSASPTSCSCDM